MLLRKSGLGQIRLRRGGIAEQQIRQSRWRKELVCLHTPISSPQNAKAFVGYVNMRVLSADT